MEIMEILLNKLIYSCYIIKSIILFKEEDLLMYTSNRLCVFVVFTILFTSFVLANDTNGIASTARVLYNDKNYNAAIDTARIVLTDTAVSKTNRDEALNIIAYAYYRKKDYHKALDEFKNITVDYPDCKYRGNAMMMVAICYKLTKNVIPAIQTYCDIINIYPNENKTFEAKYQVASMYLSLKTTNQATLITLMADTVFRSLLPDCLFLAGQVEYNKRENYTEAAKYYKEIIDNHRSYRQADDAMMMLGRSLIKQNKREDAMAMFRRVLTEFPPSNHSNEAQMEILRLTCELGLSPETVIDEAKKLLDYPDPQSRAYANIIYINTLVALDATKDAITYLEKVISTETTSYFLGKYKEKLDELKQIQKSK